MPMLKRRPFEAQKPPPNLKDDEQVYYLNLTNEIFREYDEYFARVILCNSMVWQCSLTGKANLTFQEALDSEKAARKLLKGFSRPLKTALLYLASHTSRGKAPDVVDDVIVYARDRYFKGEEVLAVIGNLWCQSKVINVIEPTPTEKEAYRLEQITKGEADKNDYLKDDSWGPAPDLFRYEIEELEPDNPHMKEVTILEAIDVKREKTVLTRDKCKYLLKLAMNYDESQRKFVVKEDVIKSHDLNKIKFGDIFIGNIPQFDVALGPAKSGVTASRNRTSASKSQKDDLKSDNTKGSTQKSKKSDGNKSTAKKSVTPIPNTNSKKASKGIVKPKPKKENVEKQLTPEELKQLEIEKKIKERETQKAQRKMMADFKKLWFKPKEDLEVEDLKDLPTPDPVSFGIPNHLFGDFIMILEFLSSYSSLVKVRDSFPSGISFDSLERALVKNEIAGPFSDILQLLLKTVFRLQEGEKLEIAKDEAATLELNVNEVGEDITVREAIQQATAAATWSYMYQNTPLYKLCVDHSSITEMLRLHLLASGAKQSRGSCAETDDPGLHLRIEDPQILKKLTTGTVFDLTIAEKLKLIQCLIHQIMSYSAVKDMMEDSFEDFKQARMSCRTLQAAEKRKEAEDHIWRQRLKTEQIPDMNTLKVGVDVSLEEIGEAPSSNKELKNTEISKQDRPLLTDEQIEAAIGKRDKEIARRKQDFLWKEAELQEAINKHEKKLGLHPFGRDRAFRRYWWFSSIPGLFVEQDDEFVGECLPTATPYMSEVNLDDVNFVKANLDKLQHSDREGSDKENSTVGTPKKSSSKKKIPTAASVKKETDAIRPKIFGVCTGDKKDCPVHCIDIPRPKWSFFWDADQIDSLIEGLSPRGIREKELRQYLMDEKENLKNNVKKCPVMKLNKEKNYPESIIAASERRPQRTGGGSTSKTPNDPNLGFTSNTSVDMIMELQLRDLILETEEKVFLGGLGSLKIKDRTEWRTAIETRTYDAGTNSLSWGGSKTIHLGEKSIEDEPTSSNSTFILGKEVNPEVNPAIKTLACAILQLQQSVEQKFLNRPLVEKDDDKKKKSKNADNNESSTWKSIWSSGPPLERWQLSLMACTSLSQLYVHFYSLESSVEWSRSVLNARCRVCRRKGDPENMLLCDACNKGHHAYCLKPTLDVIPKGDWFCVDCRPSEPLPTPSKKRRPLSDDDIMEELESEDDDEIVQRGSKKMSNLEQDDEPEVCAECGFGGEVICCDSCPLVYHLLCLNPPKTRVPRGTWYCPECTNPSKKNKRAKKHASKNRNSRPKPTKRRIQYSSSEDESENDDTMNETNHDEDDEITVKDSENEEQESEIEEENKVVKVKFGSSRKRSPTEGNSSRGSRKLLREVEESGSEKDEQSGRGSKRSASLVASNKIAQASKRLRSDSKENESSESSNDATYNSRKRSLDSSEYAGGADCPKRTRLQRMNTNNKVENGELDNVCLDKLISDVMKQSDAWPFLKPVTRTEAPDYHEIVKYPMDLGTIKYKLNSMVYTCNEEFVSDLLLVFTNCFTYNDHNHGIYEAGQNLKSYCEKKCSKLGINFSDGVSS